MYLKNCYSFDTRLRIETTYVLDNGEEWDLVWTTSGAYDKSFNKVLSLKMLNKWPNSEYKYEYKKIIMTDYCGHANEYINLYRVPRTFLTAYFDTDIISSNVRRNLAMICGHIRCEYNADIFSVILDLFTYLVISDYSLYKCAN
jgi:hypothetical protein